MSDETMEPVAKPEISYVVQQELHGGTSEDGVDNIAWRDVATVTVPVGTKRRTVLRQALASMEVDGEAPRLRALDAESADVWEPTPKTTTTWEI